MIHPKVILLRIGAVMRESTVGIELFIYRLIVLQNSTSKHSKEYRNPIQILQLPVSSAMKGSKFIHSHYYRGTLAVFLYFTLYSVAISRYLDTVSV